ncbi:MAG: hypothetical protein RI948_1570, partial [Bacteroidota bacterium]
MKSIFSSVFIVLLLTACGDDKPTPPKAQIQVSMQPVFGALPFYMDSIYTTQEGYKIKFTELKCYFTLFGNGSNAL